MKRLLFAFFLAAPPLACGGKVVVDNPSGSGGGTTTTTTTTTSSSDACPKVDPLDGEPCAVEGQTCTLTATCCTPTAVCSSGVWQVDSIACTQPCTPCVLGGPNGVACSTSAVCVETSVGAAALYHCADNPCGSDPVTCICAGKLCPAGCLGVNDIVVECNSLSQ